MYKLPLAAVLIGLATTAVAQTSPAPATGGIPFESWAVKARERLMALDTDHDGKISKEEFAARAAEMGGRRHEGAEGAAMRKAGKYDGSRMFDRFDTNKDGFIDATEINAVLAQRFARMDANHDGVLTPDEQHAMRGGNTSEQ